MATATNTRREMPAWRDGRRRGQGGRVLGGGVLRVQARDRELVERGGREKDWEVGDRERERFEREKKEQERKRERRKTFFLRERQQIG